MDRHLEVELLSVLADGELDPSTMRDAEFHLAGCTDCAAALRAISGLDAALAAPPPVACAASAELRSALVDSELSQAEAAVAAAHLSGCRSCQAEEGAWRAVEALIRALPAQTTSSVLDRRIAALTAPRTGRRLPLPGSSPSGLSGLALRGVVTAAVVAAILIGLLPGSPSSPEQAQQAPGEVQAMVAGVQQAVMYAPTNTLYVLQTDAGAVDAVDAGSYALRTRIAVGGRPSALALNEAAGRVIVLDATRRSLTEIDATSNAVVATTEIPVTGTPTSVQVDQSSGRIIVAAIPDPPIGGPAPTPTLGAQPPASGVMAVLDGTTKKLETISSLDVAPRVVVTDRSGKLTLLVSSGASTLMDASYKKIRTLPGGVAAAFAPQSGVIAVLSADAGSAVLTFNGDGAPGPLRLPGFPLAVTSVPDVGFAVLLGSGSGNGRVVVVDEAGRAIGASDVDQVGRDLAFDANAQKFTVVGGGRVASAALPTGILRSQAEAALRSAPPSSVPPASVPPATAPPSASASPAAGPSATPSAVPIAAPLAPVQEAPAPAVPVEAVRRGESLYHVALGGRIASVVTAGPGSAWFVDQHNALDRLDTASGNVFTFPAFPADARITALAVTAGAVYATDAASGRLFTLTLAGERLTSSPLPLLGAPAAIAAAPDGRLWVGVDGSGQILITDPRTKRSETLETGLASVRTIAFGPRGLAWFTDGYRGVGTWDPFGAHLIVSRVPGGGGIQHLVPDALDSAWIATSAGEISVIRSGSSRLVLNVGRPITELSIDTDGAVWFLSPAASGLRGFVYGQVEGTQLETVPAAAMSLSFSSTGRAWLADPAGGFWLQVAR